MDWVTVMTSNTKFLIRRIRYTLCNAKYFFSKIKLGKYVYIGKSVNLSRDVTIGDCSYIGQFSYIGPKVEIGNFALFSDYVNIIGKDHVFNFPGVPIILSGTPDSPSTKIGDDVWLGHAVTIIRGVEIGTGSIVAANSVVTKSIPPYEIWGGIPAKKISQRFDEEQIEKHNGFLEAYSKGKFKLKHDRQFKVD